MPKSSRRQQNPASRDNLARTRELTTKRRGEVAEAAFLHKASALGFSVAKPWGDSDRYDFILDCAGRLSRVQIKTASRVEYRVEKAGIIHMPIGKVSFPTDQLLSNFTTLLNALIKAKPQAAKGRYLKGITVSSTMGPGFQIDTQIAQTMSERLGVGG